MATVACFDTSVFLRRYVDEPGSRAARDVFRRFRPVCSALLPIEATAAIARRARAGEITEKAAGVTLSRLDHDRARLRWIDIEAPILARAEALVREVAVATLDAIHIASALVRWSLRHPWVGDVQRSVLETRDAADLYPRFGFQRAQAMDTIHMRVLVADRPTFGSVRLRFTLCRAVIQGLICMCSTEVRRRPM